MRFRGRSYMAFVLTPEPPIADWLSELDAWIQSSAGYFVGRPVVVNLSSAALSHNGIAHLLSELAAREIRIMGLEGVEADGLPPGLPPLLKGGRAVSNLEPVAASEPKSQTRGEAEPAPATPKEPPSLLLDAPVRSGQLVFFPEGDITVIGSISSGAEVVAGGSIHVYGALRGRAMAGVNGNSAARIYCQKIEAELLAIDGYYQTAEELDAALRDRPAQAWLEGSIMRITPLN